MFTNAVILILVEIIEASLLISVLLALRSSIEKISQQTYGAKFRWLYFSILFGVVGAWVYAYYTPQVSVWFDYVGQEVVNASILLVSLFWLFLLVFNRTKNHQQQAAIGTRNNILVLCMINVVFLGIVREGYEIILYIDGVARQPENLTAVLFGSTVGFGIGISCGVLLYYSLMSLTLRWTLRVSLGLLALVAGNLTAQVVQLMTQADWLAYSPIVWDSSGLLTESSITGHLLFALVGYEATPSLLQLICYGSSMLLLLVSPLNRLAWSLPKVRSGSPLSPISGSVG